MIDHLQNLVRMITIYTQGFIQPQRPSKQKQAHVNNAIRNLSQIRSEWLYTITPMQTIVSTDARCRFFDICSKHTTVRNLSNQSWFAIHLTIRWFPLYNNPKAETSQVHHAEFPQVPKTEINRYLGKQKGKGQIHKIVDWPRVCTQKKFPYSIATGLLSKKKSPIPELQDIVTVFQC
jgi:hypothetical protein